MMGFTPTSCQINQQIAKVIELYILPCFHPLLFQKDSFTRWKSQTSNQKQIAKEKKSLQKKEYL